MDLSRVPRLLVMTPFPTPLMTPPLTRIYFNAFCSTAGASPCDDKAMGKCRQTNTCKYISYESQKVRKTQAFTCNSCARKQNLGSIPHYRVLYTVWVSAWNQHKQAYLRKDVPQLCGQCLNTMRFTWSSCLKTTEGCKTGLRTKFCNRVKTGDTYGGRLVPFRKDSWRIAFSQLFKHCN